MYDVFTITPRGNGRKNWTKLGFAKPGKNGSISVKLEALPFERNLVLVLQKADDEIDTVPNVPNK